MKMNKIMSELHDGITEPFVSLPNGLADLLLGDFVEIEGCVFLSSLYSQNGNARRNMFPDDVGYECFVNHIHIDDYAKELFVEIALEFTRQLELKWIAQYINGILRIILSCEEDNYVVRFHLMREGQIWLKDDLEDYKGVALLVLDAVSHQ
jgi:hypothetical protein